MKIGSSLAARRAGKTRKNNPIPPEIRFFIATPQELILCSDSLDYQVRLQF
ncbi:MAG: hypothetical protein QNJ47_02380 [Nostocaceae cyanobacterium]|nr:hypothetical protein [Nostocaceae cyanobacterium]